MEQITITRAEYREKIVENPKGYGLVRYLHEHPEEKEGRKMKLLLEEMSLIIVLAEIERELFGEEEKEDKPDIRVMDDVTEIHHV